MQVGALAQNATTTSTGRRHLGRVGKWPGAVDDAAPGMIYTMNDTKDNQRPARPAATRVGAWSRWMTPRKYPATSTRLIGRNRLTVNQGDTREYRPCALFAFLVALRQQICAMALAGKHAIPIAQDAPRVYRLTLTSLANWSTVGTTATTTPRKEDGR